MPLWLYMYLHIIVIFQIYNVALLQFEWFVGGGGRKKKYFNFFDITEEN